MKIILITLIALSGLLSACGQPKTYAELTADLKQATDARNNAHNQSTNVEDVRKADANFEVANKAFGVWYTKWQAGTVEQRKQYEKQ
jgi:hypothetical protein